MHVDGFFRYQNAYLSLLLEFFLNKSLLNFQTDIKQYTKKYEINYNYVTIHMYISKSHYSFYECVGLRIVKTKVLCNRKEATHKQCLFDW